MIAAMWYASGILPGACRAAALAMLSGGAAGCLAIPPDPGPAACGEEDAVALYLFDEPAESGATWVENRGSGGDALDLLVREPDSVQWLGYGLAVAGPTHLVAEGPTDEVLFQTRVANALTVEAWVTQRGQRYDHTSPARIVSMSEGVQNTERNFVLGQEEGQQNDDPWERIIARVEGSYDLPTEPGPFIREAPLHLVMVVEPSLLELYVDGTLDESMEIQTDFQDWPARPINVANEYALERDAGNDRHWIGELYRIGLYPRVMSKEEVACRAGILPPGIPD